MAVAERERSSLDLGKNDSTGLETDDLEGFSDSERYDCREVYVNFEFEEVTDDEEPLKAAYRCKSWSCYCCGYHMRQNLVEEIERITEERPAMCRLLTLTLDPAKIPDDQEEWHKYLTERWNALRTRLKREVGDFSYVWVREEQENGLPHLHVIVSRFLPQAVVSNAWSELGGGEIVDIRKIDRVEKVAHYLGKYLTKDALSGLPKGIQRYNSSSDIQLNVRGGGDSETEFGLMMDDHNQRNRDGEPLRREVYRVDFVLQRQWGGPVPPDVNLAG